MRRGEIWWANLPPPVGRRPVVLLSRDVAYEVRQFVTVAPVSTRVRRLQSEVGLGHQDGMAQPCAVNLDSINTINKAALDRRITGLSAKKLQAVEEAVHFALGLGT
jgi:mRNA interferase MazF